MPPSEPDRDVGKFLPGQDSARPHRSREPVRAGRQLECSLPRSRLALPGRGRLPAIDTEQGCIRGNPLSRVNGATTDGPRDEFPSPQGDIRLARPPTFRPLPGTSALPEGPTAFPGTDRAWPR